MNIIYQRTGEFNLDFYSEVSKLEYLGDKARSRGRELKQIRPLVEDRTLFNTGSKIMWMIVTGVSWIVCTYAEKRVSKMLGRRLL